MCSGHGIRKYTELTIFPELKISEKEKSKSEMVKERGISLSIFCMLLENQDRIKTNKQTKKTAKGSEIGNRMISEKHAKVVN